MFVLARKVGTLGRIVRTQGVSGVTSLLMRRTEPASDYARLTPSAIASLTRYGRPDLLVHVIGAGIGDDLLCTAIFRELRLRGHHNFWVSNRHPQLYEHTGDAPVVVRPFSRYDVVLKKLGARVIYPYYTSYHPAYDRDDPLPEQHLISILCQRAGITGSVTLRPYLTLTAGERERGRLAPRQVAVQSSGLSAKHAMLNKNWSLDRYQRVVSELRTTYDFVQVGTRDDPPLEGALDLRGKTTLRETAAVLAGSLAFVGQVGLLMHLARAVDCRSVIVYGGRETPAQSGYPCNENLYSPVPCSPCWRLNSCPYDRMCLQMVDVAAVVEALERQVARHGNPLAVDTATITPELIAYNALRYEQAIVAHQVAWSVLREQQEARRAGRPIPRDVPRTPAQNAAPAAAAPPSRAAPLTDVPGLHIPREGLETRPAPADVLQIYDTFEGRGTVYEGEQLLADADYVLNDVQELVYQPVPPGRELRRELERGGPETVPGERSIYGFLQSPQLRVLRGAVGTRLTLRLEDGRALDVTVVKAEHAEGPTDALTIQALGGIRPAAPGATPGAGDRHAWHTPPAPASPSTSAPCASAE